MKLQKRRSSDDDRIHVVDLDDRSRALCNVRPKWYANAAFTDRLSVGCPTCRTGVTQWLLGGPV